jgi:DNA polymerase I
MEKIFIIDAVNYLFRSYYAIRPMTNDKGESTHALYGFIQSIEKLRRDFSPKYMVAVFDGPGNKESRRQVYAEYKMHRKGAPEDLYPQFEKAFHYCEMAGIAALCIPGVEADDTMASITLWAEKENLQVILCTSDKDLYQLVSDNILVLNAQKENLIIDAQKVKELFGVTPKQMLDYLSIVGDASDNIPGIEGFGPKSAALLLDKLGSLENIYQHPEAISGEKKRESFLSQKDSAFMSRKLATLNVNVEIPTSSDFFLLKNKDSLRLQPFFQEMNFMKFLQELQPEKSLSWNLLAEEKKRYTLIDQEESFLELCKQLSSTKELCIDTETTSLNPMQAELVGIGLGDKKGEAFYIPFNGKIPKHLLVPPLKKLLESLERQFYGHNIKYDLHVLFHAGIHLTRISFDTLLASYLLQPQNRQHNLDKLTFEYFHHTKISIESLLSKGKKAISMKEVPLEQVAEYCCEDVDYTIRLKELFEKEIEKESLQKVFYEIELPLLPILAKMEQKGIFIDCKIFAHLSTEFLTELKRLEKEIFQEVGKEFNLNSPKQLGDILYKDLKLTPPRKKGSEFSTAADVLEKLKGESHVIEKILQYRALQKLSSTYVETLPAQINPKTGRIHATFNQSMTATGRLSCQDPNLQNIPVRSEEGKKIRSAFKPEKEGWSYLSADYSQIELRLLAHFSEDPELTRAFLEGQDIHTSTASLIFNLPQDLVTKEMRQIAKTVNFGILYGQGPFGLSQELGVSQKEASLFIETYFERYKKIGDYLESLKEIARKTRRAKTLTGRQRPLPEIHNKNPAVRAAAERLAINTPLQGTAADLIKISMIEIDKTIQENKCRGFMILQIHDELIFEIPDEEIPIFQKFVKEKMEHALCLKVPLLVDIEIGKNWSEC